jgi:hypothetical protein
MNPSDNYKKIIDLAKEKGYRTFFSDHPAEKMYGLEMICLQVWLRVEHRVDNLVLLVAFIKGTTSQRVNQIILVINAVTEGKLVRVCELCEKIFISSISNEEAAKEYAEKFGPLIATYEPASIVCADCYNSFDKEDLQNFTKKMKEDILKSKSN